MSLNAFSFGTLKGQDPTPQDQPHADRKSGRAP